MQKAARIFENRGSPVITNLLSKLDSIGTQKVVVAQNDL